VSSGLRRLVAVLGDQLNTDAAVFDDFDDDCDAVWMAELAHEAAHVWAHQKRLVQFFAAMRHHRDALRQAGRCVYYHELGATPGHDRGETFEGLLAEDLRALGPDELVVVQPGDYRVLLEIRSAAAEAGVALTIHPDRHFLCPLEGFAAWAKGRRSLVMEHFYRAMRREHSVLMDGREPAGGQWNWDTSNRKTFGRNGPGALPSPPLFEPDATTRAVIELVSRRFPDHPGDAAAFQAAVTPDQARQALGAFIRERLPRFGDYQDALWTDTSLAYHSQLSAALNLHLLDPKEVITAAEAAYERGDAPLNAVEGFIRQILGWREFVRGIYWTYMPDYAQRNALGAEADVPALMWHGETEMACVADSMRNVLANGYAHHIQRLMVLGLFAQLYGVQPYAFHEWHMALYVDAVDWVSLPNALGMSQYGDGGVMGSKPYCASGAYIQRMSNYCAHCRFDPKKAVGDDACPFTTLYWDFLDRHAEQFRGNRRLTFQLRHRDQREARGDMEPIRRQAARLKKRIRDDDGV